MNREQIIGIEVEYGRTISMGNYEFIRPQVRLPASILTAAELEGCRTYSEIIDTLWAKCDIELDREEKYKKLVKTYQESYYKLSRWEAELEGVSDAGFTADQQKVLREIIERRIEEKRQDEEEKRQKKLSELDSIIDSAKASLSDGYIWKDSLMSHQVRQTYDIHQKERSVLQRMTVAQVVNSTAEELLPLLSEEAQP